MKKFIDVYLFHLKNLLRQKGFIISTCVVVLVLIGSTFLSMKLNENEKKTDITISVEAESPYAINEEAFDDSLRDTYAFRIKEMTEKEIVANIESGEESDVFHIEVKDNKPVVAYYYENTPKQGALYAIEQQMKQYYIQQVALEENIPAESVQKLFQPIEITHMKQKDTEKTFGLIYPFVLMMYVFILGFAQTVAINVTSEKASRVMELLLPKVSPIYSLYAKMISALTAGIIQFTAIIGTVFGLRAIGWIEGEQMNVLGFSVTLSDIHPAMFFWFAFFFITGFLFYALLYAALGSSVNKVEELQGAMTPLVFVQMGALGLGVFTIFDPDHIATIIASYVPPFTPVVLFSRILLGEATSFEITTALLLFFLSTAVITYYCQKWYRNGVTSTGAKKKRWWKKSS